MLFATTNATLTTVSKATLARKEEALTAVVAASTPEEEEGEEEQEEEAPVTGAVDGPDDEEPC